MAGRWAPLNKALDSARRRRIFAEWSKNSAATAKRHRVPNSAAN